MTGCWSSAQESSEGYGDSSNFDAIHHCSANHQSGSCPDQKLESIGGSGMKTCLSQITENALNWRLIKSDLRISEMVDWREYVLDRKRRTLLSLHGSGVRRSALKKIRMRPCEKAINGMIKRTRKVLDKEKLVNFCYVQQSYQDIFRSDLTNDDTGEENPFEVHLRPDAIRRRASAQDIPQSTGIACSDLSRCWRSNDSSERVQAVNGTRQYWLFQSQEIKMSWEWLWITRMQKLKFKQWHDFL